MSLSLWLRGEYTGLGKSGAEINYTDLVFYPREGMVYETGEDGYVVVDMENTGFFNSLAQRFFKKPRISHIRLDAIGSRLWQLMDTKSSVYDIACRLEEEFPGEDDMLARVVTFFQKLERYGWVARK